MVSDDSRSIEQYVDAATRYCAALEGPAGTSATGFIRRMAELLPELYRAALALPDLEPATTKDDLALCHAALEEARAIRDALPTELERYATYWFIFDPIETPPDEAVAGDLRADLLEIYEDVRTGLLNWSTASASDRLDLVWQWRFDFVHHWGRHATVALAAIHVLLFDRFIDSGSATTPVAP